MSSNDELMAKLAAFVEALREAGLEPVLIGGLAVDVRRHISSEDIDLRAPASLASLPRTTKDIDLAIRYERGAEHTAAALLARHGLRPSSTNSWCFLGADVQIDIIPCIDTWSSEDSFCVEPERVARPLVAAQVSVERVADIHMGVGKRALLVVQKALAWSERYYQSDLADVATLALSDFVEDGNCQGELEDLMAGLPKSYAQRLQELAARFESEDAKGPAAFFAAIEDAMRSRLLSVSEDDEFIVRQIASEAVRRLLAPWR